MEIMQTQNYKVKRNHGIDLLKIISMFMIVILHIQNHGGLLENAKPFTISNYIVWFLEVAVFCSVNCFALVSGFVSYGRKHKYSNLLYLLFQVSFYTVLTTAFFLVFNRSALSSFDILKAVFPFAYRTYWYFSAYFCMFFFIPVYNKIIEKTSLRELGKLLIIITVVFSFLPTVFHYDFPILNNGCSFLWLSVLYLFGGTIKKYNIQGFRKNKYNLLGYVICIVVCFLSKVFIDNITYRILGEAKGGTYLIAYNSPLILLSAIFLMLYCSRLSFDERTARITSIISSVTFGIYLLHEEPLIRQELIKGRFLFCLEMHPLTIIPIVLGTALAICIIGICVDYIRLKFFDILHIRKLCNTIVQKLSNFFRLHIDNITKKIETDYIDDDSNASQNQRLQI